MVFGRTGCRFTVTWKTMGWCTRIGRVLCWCTRTTCSTRIRWKSCLHRRHLKIHEELCKLQVHLTFDCHPEFVVFVDCLRLPNLYFLPVWRLAQPLHQRKKAQFNNNLKYNEREYNYITLELWIVNLFQEYHHPRQSQLQLEIQLNLLWFLYYGGGGKIFPVSLSTPPES